MFKIEPAGVSNEKTGYSEQMLLEAFNRSLDTLDGMAPLARLEVSNDQWVRLTQKLMCGGMAARHLISFSRLLEREGRGDCSIMIMKMLVASNRSGLEAKAYYTKLIVDFDPSSSVEPCNDLLKDGRNLVASAALDISYSADRLMEIGLLNKDDYLIWIENTLKDNRIPDLLARYSVLLRELRRYDEAYIVAKEAIDMGTGAFQPYISGAIAASSLAMHEESYSLVMRAFETNAHATWWNMVVKYSPYSVTILTRGNYLGIDRKFIKWFDEKVNKEPDIAYLPYRFTPWHVKNMKEKRAKRISQGLPSAMLITQSKSGSISVGNILSGGFDLPCITYSVLTHQVLPSMLNEYLRGGACYVTHLQPTEINIDMFKAMGVSNLTVHVRDPRQILLSLVHHNMKYEKHSYSINRREAYHVDPDVQRLIDHAINVFWKKIVDFQAGWLQASKKINITFTTFEHFVTDRSGFVNRLIDAYGGDRRFFNKEAAFFKDVNRDNHFRKGQLDEWREVFTPAQIKRINSTLPRDLADFFGWKP